VIVTEPRGHGAQPGTPTAVHRCAAIRLPCLIDYAQTRHATGQRIVDPGTRDDSLSPEDARGGGSLSAGIPVRRCPIGRAGLLDTQGAKNMIAALQRH
jgi:hypothetical protein